MMVAKNEKFPSLILWTASLNLSATILFALQRFVLSAAHCFCVDKWGAPCKWNNQVFVFIFVFVFVDKGSLQVEQPGGIWICNVLVQILD